MFVYQCRNIVGRRAITDHGMLLSQAHDLMSLAAQRRHALGSERVPDSSGHHEAMVAEKFRACLS